MIAAEQVTELRTPTSVQGWDAVRTVLREYAEQLGVDLSFQDFETEFLRLPGPCEAPRGALLTMHVDGHVAGCRALRPLDTTDYANAGDMKRLFIRPQYRGRGLGRLLAEAIMDTAQQGGYACLLLDTLNDMETARALYQDLGFVEIPPCYYNPITGSHYLKADL